jgi:IQ and AAA domain-containing protein
MAREKFDKNNQLNFFLFYGPHGVGKTLAIRALATECNAIVIDLSPFNLEGKYQEKNPFPGCINAAFKVA